MTQVYHKGLVHITNNSHHHLSLRKICVARSTSRVKGPQLLPWSEFTLRKSGKGRCRVYLDYRRASHWVHRRCLCRLWYNVETTCISVVYRVDLGSKNTDVDHCSIDEQATDQQHHLVYGIVSGEVSRQEDDPQEQCGRHANVQMPRLVEVLGQLPDEKPEDGTHQDQQ